MKLDTEHLNPEVQHAVEFLKTELKERILTGRGLLFGSSYSGVIFMRHQSSVKELMRFIEILAGDMQGNYPNWIQIDHRHNRLVFKNGAVLRLQAFTQRSPLHQAEQYAGYALTTVALTEDFLHDTDTEFLSYMRSRLRDTNELTSKLVII